jgi:hypothetical protein
MMQVYILETMRFSSLRIQQAKEPKNDARARAAENRWQVLRIQQAKEPKNDASYVSIGIQQAKEPKNDARVQCQANTVATCEIQQAKEPKNDARRWYSLHHRRGNRRFNKQKTKE